MTSAIAIIGLTYAATDVQDFDGLHLEITQGLGDSPTVRGTDVTVPGAAGQTARPRKFHERRLLLAGPNSFVRGDGATEALRQADYRTNVRAMLALFDPAAAPADLVATLENGYTATIAARTLSVATVELVPSEWAAVSIELLALEDWTYEVVGS